MSTVQVSICPYVFVCAKCSGFQLSINDAFTGKQLRRASNVQKVNVDFVKRVVGKVDCTAFLSVNPITHCPECLSVYLVSLSCGSEGDVQGPRVSVPGMDWMPLYKDAQAPETG